MKRTVSGSFFAVFVLFCLGAMGAETPARDGSHDFDFNVGTWKTHIVRLKSPLSDSKETITLDGTVHVQPFWNGTGLYEEIEADGPNGHWEGMTFFLYNPKSGQWSQRFVNSNSGQLQSGTFGGFRDGRGELYAQDTYKGRSILVRGTWSAIKPDSHTYEEAFSTDGGATWQTVFTGLLTRTTPVAPPAFTAKTDGGHDFDFDFGVWQTKTSRLKKTLSGSKDWIESGGTTRVIPLWSGRANLAEFSTDGAAGHLELVALRLFDPAAKQWNINFAVRCRGTWSVPMIGEFKDGRGEFFDQEEYDGRMILVRVRFTKVSPAEIRSEQAFSDDGGKTWETNWLNHYTREAR